MALGRPDSGLYAEQVVRSYGNGRYDIRLRRLSGLGSATELLIPHSGSTTTTGAIGNSLAASAQGFLIGGPVGAVAAGVAALISSLWAGHAARAKGAKDENTAMNSAVQAFDGSLQAIFAAANAGTITAAQASQYCQQNMQSYWTGMAPYMTGPGRADKSNGGANCGTLNPAGPCSGMIGGPKCDKSCTAGCCVGCQDLYPTTLAATQVFASPTGGTVTACAVAGSKYGGVARGSYSLTYTPPPPVSAAGLSSAVGSIGTASIAGIPLWMLLVGGGLAVLALRR